MFEGHTVRQSTMIPARFAMCLLRLIPRFSDEDVEILEAVRA